MKFSITIVSAAILALAAASPVDNPNTNGLKNIYRREGVGNGGAAGGSIPPPLSGPCQGDAVSPGRLAVPPRIFVNTDTACRVVAIQSLGPMATWIAVDVTRGKSAAELIVAM